MSLTERLCSVGMTVALLSLLTGCGEDGAGGDVNDGDIADTGDVGPDAGIDAEGDADAADVGSDPGIDAPDDGGGDTLGDIAFEDSGGDTLGDVAPEDSGGDTLGDVAPEDSGGDALADISVDLGLDVTYPTTLIGPEGGTVVSNDGLLTLEIPPYAVTEEVEIAAVRLDDVDEERFYDGVAYGMVPHGLTFEVPATLRIEYDSPPPAGSSFGIGRNHEELIEVWPIVRSEGNVVEALIDGFDDGRPVARLVSRGVAQASARDGLILCDSRDHCPRLEMLSDGSTVWIQTADNNASLQFASNNSLQPPALSSFHVLAVTVEAGRRVHHLSGSAAIYWYRYNDPLSPFVSRIAYFGNAGPVAVNNLRAVSPSSGTVRLSWEPIPFEVGGEVVVERSTSGVNNRTEIGTLGVGSNSLLDAGLEPNTAYWYFVHHVKDKTAGPRSAVAIKPEGACTITVSAYGEELVSGAPQVLKNSAVVLEMSDICLPSGTPRYEWVRYVEVSGEEGGLPTLTRELIRLGQAREATMTQDAHFWVEVCMKATACAPEDVIAADDIWVYTTEPEFPTDVVVSPTITPTAQQPFSVSVRSDGNVLSLSEGGAVTSVELAVWSIEAPPTLPVMVYEATLSAPDDTLATFDIAGGAIPHNSFGYDLRIRVFDDTGVVSIPTPSGVYVQE